MCDNFHSVLVRMPLFEVSVKAGEDQNPGAASCMVHMFQKTGKIEAHLWQQPKVFYAVARCSEGSSIERPLTSVSAA